MSIRVDGSLPAADCVALAQAADAAGLAGVWFAENAFARGILPAAAACAAATRRLSINAGVFNPYSRHPTMMAMEIAALDELSNGRTTLGIGAGIMAATERMGFSTGKPVVALRDTLTILRGLLRGEAVDHAGRAFSAKGVKLEFPPRRAIPIFLAGRGQWMVKLSGELADGLLISNMCSLGFAERATQMMQAGRRAAGRPGAGEAIQYMPCAVHRDPGEALKAANRTVGEMLPRFWTLGEKVTSAKDALLTGAGIAEDDLARAAARLRAGEDPTAVLDERYANAFTLWGTPQGCLALAQAHRAAGVTELALTFSGADAREQIASIGRALAEQTPAA
ncbi:MAG: LLM class flavin-dependent oxidoreductase [Hyphomicrobiales bacterium]|nr:LLM class flavin-dependent oxidoreductase [Hyphomicrobiales bacterium]